MTGKERRLLLPVSGHHWLIPTSVQSRCLPNRTNHRIPVSGLKAADVVLFNAYAAATILLDKSRRPRRAFSPPPPDVHGGMAKELLQSLGGAALPDGLAKGSTVGFPS
jgi:hypothetical protein